MTDIDYLRDRAKASDEFPGTLVYASQLKALLEAYDEALRQIGYWHDEARRHAESAARWRAQAEGLHDQRRDVGSDHEGATCD